MHWWRSSFSCFLFVFFFSFPFTFHPFLFYFFMSRPPTLQRIKLSLVVFRIVFFFFDLLYFLLQVVALLLDLLLLSVCFFLWMCEACGDMSQLSFGNNALFCFHFFCFLLFLDFISSTPLFFYSAISKFFVLYLNPRWKTFYFCLFFYGEWRAAGTICLSLVSLRDDPRAKPGKYLAV